jgi:hypothetical protein
MAPAEYETIQACRFSSCAFMGQSPPKCDSRVPLHLISLYGRISSTCSVQY